MRVLWAILAAMFWLGEAWADTRVALVIGNSAYQNASRLPNPINDATAIASLLRSAGFEVVDLHTDLSANELRRAVRNFGSAAQNADVALVYFAGHGIEVDGNNYLVPVDAQLERDLDVEDESLSLERILKIIEPARRLRLVILDACRDNPFVKTVHRTLAARSIGRGLARVEPGTFNTLIAFAAKAGSTASDGGGPNSPFTAALLKHLVTPSVDLRIAFGRVRDEVLGATGSKQEPFVYGSLGGSFVSLSPEPQKSEATQATPSVAPVPDARIDYEFAERVGTVEAWDYFLAAHGTGYYANLARAQRAKLAPQRPPERPINIAVAPEPGAQTPPTSATPRPMLAPAELARLLQAELKRIGCDPGAVDGSWTDRSRRALDAFNRHAGTKFDVQVASIDTLEAVRATSSRVCPLICARGMRAAGDHCVRITCNSGLVLGRDGSCQKRKERPKPAARTVRTRGGGNCLSFGGRRICE